jgi:hypothetical protein
MNSTGNLMGTPVSVTRSADEVYNTNKKIGDFVCVRLHTVRAVSEELLKGFSRNPIFKSNNKRKLLLSKLRRHVAVIREHLHQLTSALVGGEWPTARACCFIAGKERRYPANSKPGGLRSLSEHWWHKKNISSTRIRTQGRPVRRLVYNGIKIAHTVWSPPSLKLRIPSDNRPH